MKIKIIADYGQICVFNPDLQNPFNDWEDDHVKQGFSWRHGSVSFSVPFSGEWDFYLSLQEQREEVNRNKIRIISVPLEVTPSGIEIGGVLTSQIYDIDKGFYELIFTLFSHSDNSKDLAGSLTFIKKDQLPLARIIFSDDELNPLTELRMSANPA